jgi:hypothetical protein
MDEQKQGIPKDPSGIPEPHDVLAAEEFGIGARDERLPPDPTGIHEPHDVLAAEEFAMPVVEDFQHGYGDGSSSPRTPILIAAAALTLLWLLLRRR